MGFVDAMVDVTLILAISVGFTHALITSIAKNMGWLKKYRDFSFPFIMGCNLLMIIIELGSMYYSILNALHILRKI